MKRDTDSNDLDALLAEYLRLVDQGSLDRNAFLRRHPEQAEALIELLDTEAEILRLAGPLVGIDDEGSDSEDDVDPMAVTAPLPVPRTEQETLAVLTDVPDLSNSHDKSASDIPPGPKPPSDDEQEWKPVDFGNYQLLELLGRGGMGVVYRARQKGLERSVAVKMILNAHLASDEDIERFYTEARAAANIRHENVVDIYEIGEVDHQHFFSMELIEGMDLSQLLKEGRLESRRAARLMRDVAKAVHAAHELGVLHRDLKPANILVDEHERVVVTDFGLAREIDAEDQQRLTATGLAMGTPSYMSPEQASGDREQVNRTSDVYSLGTVLYAMLTGSPPHQGQTVMETLTAVIHQPAPHPSRLNADAAPNLCRICLKCLEKDPSSRYQSAKELAEDLERFLNGQPVLAQQATITARVAQWLGQVPIIAALRGRVAHHPTAAQLASPSGDDPGLLVARDDAGVVPPNSKAHCQPNAHDSLLRQWTKRRRLP